jgi:hypothetical protein
MKNFFVKSLLVACLLSFSASVMAQSVEAEASQATDTVVSEITNIAATSSCSHYAWRNRGRAPAAYVEGMAVTFAKSICRLRAGDSGAQLTAEKNTGNTAKDAIAWYENQFDSLELPIENSGADTLRSLYTLGLGLGMRESSGQYCTGYDTSAGPETASTAEAGTFQTSYNAMVASPELGKLYASYKKNPSKCYLDIYSKNVSCTHQNIVGTGAGADYQRFVKSCPAFGAESAMMGLRVLRKQWGPINRKEAEVNSSCDQMFGNVQEFVQDNANKVCPYL